VLGVAFPVGLRRLREWGGEDLIPYLWGINAVFSVFGSVLATVTAVSSGYRAGLLAGLGAYLVALIMAVWRPGESRHGIAPARTRQPLVAPD